MSKGKGNRDRNRHTQPDDDQVTSDSPPTDVPVETLAETENYVAWLSREPDGEVVYHLELGAITLHFFQEEWDEMLALVEEAQEADS